MPNIDTTQTRNTEYRTALPPGSQNISPMTDTQVRARIDTIADKLETEAVELTVVWYQEADGPSSPFTWVGTPQVTYADDGSRILEVLYKNGHIFPTTVTPPFILRCKTPPFMLRNWALTTR